MNKFSASPFAKLSPQTAAIGWSKCKSGIRTLFYRVYVETLPNKRLHTMTTDVLRVINYYFLHVLRVSSTIVLLIVRRGTICLGVGLSLLPRVRGEKKPPRGKRGLIAFCPIFRVGIVWGKQCWQHVARAVTSRRGCPIAVSFEAAKKENAISAQCFRRKDWYVSRTPKNASLYFFQ